MIFATPSDQFCSKALYTPVKFRFHKATPTSHIFFSSGWSLLMLSGIRFHRNLAAHLKENSMSRKMNGENNHGILTDRCRVNRRLRVVRKLQKVQHIPETRFPSFPAFREAWDVPQDLQVFPQSFFRRFDGENSLFTFSSIRNIWRKIYATCLINFRA